MLTETSRTPDQKGLGMDAMDLLEVLRPGPPAAEPPHLITCSLCLRVLRGSEWMEAERVITELGPMTSRSHRDWNPQCATTAQR
jgi:hypothetical protein